jgi:hypothetical protein
MFMFRANYSEAICEGDTMVTPHQSQGREQTKRAFTVELCSLLSQTMLDNLLLWTHSSATASNFECVGGEARLSLMARAYEGAKVFTNV